MEIENQAFTYGPLPRSIVDTVKVGEGVLNSSFGKESIIGERGVVMVPGSKIAEVQNRDFVKTNLIGKMAVERGLDLGIVFTPQKSGVITEDEKGKQTILLSADAFRPLYFLNKGDINQRGQVSNGCVYVFSSIQDLLLKKLPREVPLASNPDLVDHATTIIPEFLRNQNKSANDPRIEDFAREFGVFMEANTQRIQFSVNGFTLNVNIGDQKVFSILTGQDHAIRWIIEEPVIERFIKVMKNKFIWFNPDPDLDMSVFHNSYQMKSAANLIHSIPTLKTIGDLLRTYKSSELGRQVGEVVIKTLMVDRHGFSKEDEARKEEETEDINLWDNEEELEVGQVVRVNSPKRYSNRDTKRGKFRAHDFED